MTEKKSQEKQEKENYSFYIFETSAHRLRRLYWYIYIYNLFVASLVNDLPI